MNFIQETANAEQLALFAALRRRPGTLIIDLIAATSPDAVVRPGTAHRWLKEWAASGWVEIVVDPEDAKRVKSEGRPEA